MAKNNVTTDEKVLNLWNTVRERQKEISNTDRIHWETSCTIGYNPDTITDRINIQTVREVNKLVEIYAFLLLKEEKWNKACEELKINAEFTWMGFKSKDWFKDIKSRISQINLTVKRDELKQLEARLNALITIDQRRELELAEVSKLIYSTNEN